MLRKPGQIPRLNCMTTASTPSAFQCYKSLSQHFIREVFVKSGAPLRRIIRSLSNSIMAHKEHIALWRLFTD